MQAVHRDIYDVALVGMKVIATVPTDPKQARHCGERENERKQQPDGARGDLPAGCLLGCMLGRSLYKHLFDIVACAVMVNPLRVLFFGTSHFAVPTLRCLSESGHELLAVYTQPDRPAGRGRKLRPSPVAMAAGELGLPVEQPERVRKAEVVERLRGYAPDVVVLAAYGLLIPQAALDVPPLGWLNVHPSLLPLYRGASPVVAPILQGDTETGVTIFLMRAGLDNGPVLSQTRTPIGADETAGELEARLARLGASQLVETLSAWSKGELEPKEQDDDRATYAPKLTKEEALLDWSDSAEQLARRVRAYNPWPVAYTYWQGERLRILRGEPVDGEAGHEPGEVYLLASNRLPVVACGEGALALREVQLAGARAVDGRSFVAGHAGFVGARLGSAGEPG